MMGGTPEYYNKNCREWKWDALFPSEGGRYASFRESSFAPLVGNPPWHPPPEALPKALLPNQSAIKF
jgi:hypothetical protein